MSGADQIRSVGVVAKRSSETAVQMAAELIGWLLRRRLDVAADGVILEARQGKKSAREYDSRGSYDLVVVLGGDGTLLSVARSLTYGTPILGVNVGTLGFLTEVGRDDLYPALVDVLAGRYELEERALLETELRRAAGGVSTYHVLNDAVIAKSALARIIELTLHVDGRLVANYRSDGLIISTPTGSTAYNLSAGGPIVHPLLPVLLLTPICAHGFSMRPIVVPDTGLIEVTLETRREEVYLTLDGQEGTAMEHRDSIRVRRSDARVRLVKTTGHTFYDGLRGKLHWGG